MTSTKKSRIIRKKGHSKDDSNLGMKDQISSKINRTIPKKMQMVDQVTNSMSNQITTKKLCSLQIQRQKDVNDNYSMDNTNEMYVNFLTEEELDETINRILDSKRFLDYQKRKIAGFFKHIKETGWFQRFEYKGYECAVEFDDLGRWRIFFVPKQGEHRSPLYDHECSCNCYCYMTSSSRFSLSGFPLGLWDYSDKIGLDDFIGLPTFAESEWQFDFFLWKKRWRNRKFADRISVKLVDINYAIKMNKKLVDCWIRYQKIKNRKWKCSLCTIEFADDDLINERKKRHEEWHTNCKLQKRNTTEGVVEWKKVI